MRDARQPRRRITRQDLNEIAELSLRPPPDQRAIFNSANPRRVIPAILHPLQAIDQPVRDGGFAYNADNAAHGFYTRLELIGNTDARHFCWEILGISCHKNATVNLSRRKDDGINSAQSNSFAAQCRGKFCRFLI